MLSKKFIPFVTALSLFSMLNLNCGGGGGGGSNEGGFSNPENPPIAPKKLSVISGFIHIGSDINNYPVGVLSSIVQIVSIDKNGNEIDRKSITTTNGKFSINAGLDDNGGFIVITVSADGYTPGTKTITYNSPEDFNNLVIAVRIDPVTKKIISINEISVSEKREKVVKVNFYKDSKGNIYTSDKISKKSTDKLELSLAVPIKKLQTDTDKLLIEYKSYKPSNPDEYQNFPGEYADNGEQLVSVGFFTLDIKDPKTGKNPFVQNVSPQLVKNQGEYYRLLSFVDCNQLLKIKNSLGSLDEDPDKNGIQLTFYAFDFDKGAWVEAGEGTFVSSPDVQYEKFGEDQNTIDTEWDYIIFNGCVNAPECSASNLDSEACIDVNGDNILEDVSCEGNYVILNEDDICTTIKPVYVVVSVTNPELEWKNLDYIKPSTNTIKFTVVAKDDENNPVALPVSLIPDNECIEYISGYTSESQGKAKLETLRYCDNTFAHIEYINPYTGDVGQTSSRIIQDNDVITISLVNPLKCKLYGTVLDEANNPKRNIPVDVFAETTNFFRGLFTDNDGKFETNVPCNIPLSVAVSYDYQNLKHANVDGKVNFDEDNDNGREAYLKNIVETNKPPEGYVYLSTYATKRGSTVYATVVAWDFEQDTPITYRLDLVDNDTAVKSYTGSIQYNYGGANISIDTSQLPDKEASYKVQLFLEDSKGKSKIMDFGFLHITPQDQNLPPVITYFYALPTTAKPGEEIGLYGSAYDLDSETVSSQVHYQCFDGNDNIIDEGYTEHGNNLFYQGYETFTIPNNTNIKLCKFRWELSDGENVTTSEEVSVEVENLPPEVYIWPEKYAVPTDEDSVTIYALVSDPNDDELTCNWYINGELDNDNHSCEEYTLDLTVFEPMSDIEIKLEVSDGVNTSESTTTVHYGNPGDINIIIQ